MKISESEGYPMQEQLSELIMPLSEALVKPWSDLLAKQDKHQVTFYGIE